MNIQRIKALLEEKGYTPSSIDADRMQTLVGCQSVCEEMRIYCAELMTSTGAMASGIGVLGSDRVFDENYPGVSPGGVLNKYGYFVIATSVGGNVLTVHVESGCVYWADTSCIDEVEIAVRQPSGGYEYRACSPEAVEDAMTMMSRDLGSFLYMLFADELTEKMDELDS